MTAAARPGTRWGILGTANIARGQFLPGLRHAGGMAAAVAGRDLARAREYASANGVDRAVEGYQSLIDDPGIDALYIPLPNSLHAEWTIAALRAGKPVLCEKPLTGQLTDTERVLEVAQETGTLLWEAFVFPFQEQLTQVRQLVADGVIGELREIQSSFHFNVTRPDNIRMQADLEGGALRDVGCYPIRLAFELFGEEHETAQGRSEPGGHGVDIETWGILGYDGGRQLLVSSGMRRAYDAFSRLLGSTGQIHLTNPFHPAKGDSYTVFARGAEPRTVPAADVPSFAPAIAHIQQVLAGEEKPRMLALDTSLATARALQDLAAASSL
jgi:predicted dehydrogenase